MKVIAVTVIALLLIVGTIWNVYQYEREVKRSYWMVSNPYYTFSDFYRIRVDLWEGGILSKVAERDFFYWQEKLLVVANGESFLRLVREVTGPRGLRIESKVHDNELILVAVPQTEKFPIDPDDSVILKLRVSFLEWLLLKYT